MTLFAALLPFIAVAPDHWTFEFRGGLQDARTGKRALHIACEGAGTEIVQKLEIPSGRAISAAVWSRGPAVA